MSIRAHVRKLKPLKESFDSPVDKVQSFFSEAYSFFPKSEKEIPYSTRVQEFEKRAVRQEKERLEMANKLSIDKLFDE